MNDLKVLVTMKEIWKKQTLKTTGTEKNKNAPRRAHLKPWHEGVAEQGGKGEHGQKTRTLCRILHCNHIRGYS